MQETTQTGNQNGETPSVEKKAPLSARIGARFRTKGIGHAMILNKEGRVEWREVKGSLVNGKNGVYVPEDAGRYYNPRWIPPGWVTVYTQDDPEPINADRKPVGYNAKFLSVHTGHFPTHVIGGAFAGRGVGWDWKKVALGAFVLVGLAVVVYVYLKQRGVT